MTVDIASLVSDNLDIWTTSVERKSGTGRGGGKRINLYGIDSLRALILDLAVRGKLVSQDSNEEPAADLLKRIRKAKAQRVLSGEIRKPRRLDNDHNLKPPFSIPDTWQWIRLDEVGAIVGGGTPPAGNAGNFVDGGQGVPWLTPADLGGYKGRFIFHGERDLTEAGLKASSATVMPTGSVLFTSRAPIGYVVIAANPISTNQGFKSIVPYIAECSPFIATAMKSFAKTINDNAPGTTFKEVSGKMVAALPFPLPPIAEQRRIVAKVDELMALCDALETESASAITAHQTLVEALLTTLTTSTDVATNWARLEAHFDTLFTTEASIEALKQTILELAVRGKLVTPTNATPWNECKLGTVVSRMDSGWSPACHPFPVRTAEVWGVLKTTAIQNLDYQPEQNKELPDNLIPRPAAECRVGDILITRAGPTNRVGICCYVGATRPRLMISDKIVRFRAASDQLDGAFLALILSVGPAAAQIERAKSGMAASQVNISQAKLREVVVSLPILAEQRRIVAKVSALMALCDALKARLVDAAQTQCDLADAITQPVAS
ncbi:restriction endonuclease subunit S [Gluconobacter sp. NFX36]|uniref:EcoKI restriction-modification system protein HsdS n=1 Tax=Gluconobacter cerinus TaxID=38307 RepID=A0A1B6VJP1_9PROT|nr:restriction endonuclease subunit S [Gluconobacter cerinus]OAJ67445.1 EcoKI restriction-modification system protein HsdS [Gluconobacter cerinus]